MQVFTHWRGGAEAGAAQAVAEHGKGTECPGVEAARKPGHKGKTPTMYKCRCMVKSGLLFVYAPVVRGGLLKMPRDRLKMPDIFSSLDLVAHYLCHD